MMEVAQQEFRRSTSAERCFGRRTIAPHKVETLLPAVFGDDEGARAVARAAKIVNEALSAFQQAAEWLFETLSRLVGGSRAVDSTLASIGMTFGSVGIAYVEARSRRRSPRISPAGA
jgi:hypothetical protein